MEWMLLWVLIPLAGLGIMPSLAALARLPSPEGLLGPPPIPAMGPAKRPPWNIKFLDIDKKSPFFSGTALKFPWRGFTLVTVLSPQCQPNLPQRFARETGNFLPEFWSTKAEDGEPSRDSKPRRTWKVTFSSGYNASVRMYWSGPPRPHTLFLSLWHTWPLS